MDVQEKIHGTALHKKKHAKKMSHVDARKKTESSKIWSLQAKTRHLFGWLENRQTITRISQTENLKRSPEK
jgi:hypothetical protein